MESLLKKPVLDETGLTNHYDYELKWDAKEREHPDLEALVSAAREQLGVELTPARRMIEVLLVNTATTKTE